MDKRWENRTISGWSRAIYQSAVAARAPQSDRRSPRRPGQVGYRGRRRTADRPASGAPVTNDRAAVPEGAAALYSVRSSRACSKESVDHLHWAKLADSNILVFEIPSF